MHQRSRLDSNIGHKMYLNCGLMGLTIDKMKGKQTSKMLSSGSNCSFYRLPLSSI